jgi:PD-(D/E)XK nuclease superfamily
MSTWSFSRYKTFEQCHAKYDYRYNLKVPDNRGSGPAAERGVRIHKEIEESIKGTGAPPVEASFVGDHLGAIRVSGIPATAEFVLKLAKDWTLAPNPEDYWLHCILDLYTIPEPTVAEVWDWKTGKRYPEHDEQKELYAIAVLSAYPEIEIVRTKFAYLDQGSIIPKEFGRHHVEAAQERWNRKIERMHTATEFIPMPTFACRWCGYSSAFGGPCRF